MDNLEMHLSCLSCSKLPPEQLMLICGHSICNDCISAHSDPKSKESIIHCEECGVETKNKQLVKSLCTKNLTLNYSKSKQLIEALLGAL